jgi:hypothetical protein
MSLKVNNTTSRGQVPFAAQVSSPTPCGVLGVSSQPDALHSYVKVHQHAGGNCIVNLLSTMAQCVCSLFRKIFCFCCASKKEESPPIINPEVIREDELIVEEPPKEGSLKTDNTINPEEIREEKGPIVEEKPKEPPVSQPSNEVVDAGPKKKEIVLRFPSDESEAIECLCLVGDHAEKLMPLLLESKHREELKQCFVYLKQVLIEVGSTWFGRGNANSKFEQVHWKDSGVLAFTCAYVSKAMVHEDWEELWTLFRAAHPELFWKTFSKLWEGFSVQDHGQFRARVAEKNSLGEVLAAHEKYCQVHKIMIGCESKAQPIVIVKKQPEPEVYVTPDFDSLQNATQQEIIAAWKGLNGGWEFIVWLSWINSRPNSKELFEEMVYHLIRKIFPDQGKRVPLSNFIAFEGFNIQDLDDTASLALNAFIRTYMRQALGESNTMNRDALLELLWKANSTLFTNAMETLGIGEKGTLQQWHNEKILGFSPIQKQDDFADHSSFSDFGDDLESLQNEFLSNFSLGEKNVYEDK